jgi:ATP-binding cassette subfamily C (CFTR/MRP) protein 1
VLTLTQVEGATTIRAFGWQKKFESKNIAQLDKSQSPFYLLLCLQRWLNVVLDLLIAGVAVGVISVALAFRGTMTGGQVGVALNMVLLANTTLLRLVDSYTSLEISLGAIARLKDAIQEAPQEDEPREERGVIPGWPSVGTVQVDQLQVSYK